MADNKQLTFIDFFAGIGGIRLGMEQAGHKCLGFCECDKYAIASYTSMHCITEKQREFLTTLPLRQRQKEILKEEYRNGEWFADNITTVKGKDIPDCDVWVGGFPCQEISIAGNQKGFDGNKSSLFFEIIRLLKEKQENKPKWIVLENVRNILSIKRGGVFARVLIELDSCGYDVAWRMLNSTEFVPQNRERVYFVAGLRESGADISKVFPDERTDGQNNFQVTQIGQRNRLTRQNLNQYRVYSPEGIAPTLNKMEGGGREPMIGIKVVDNTRKKKDYGEDKERVLSADGICPTLNSSDYKEPLKVAIPVLTPEREKKRQMGRRFKENGEPAFTLTALDRHGVCVGVDINISDDSHPSIYIQISNSCIGYATWYEKENCYVVVRKITPKESFRLQGFSDEMFDRAQFVNSDSQLYKQAGNSVTVPVIKSFVTNIN